MGQAKIRGTREERICNAITASDARKLLQTQKEALERKAFEEVRLKAIAIQGAKSINIPPPRGRAGSGSRLSSMHRGRMGLAAITAMAIATMPINPRQVNKAPKP